MAEVDEEADGASAPEDAPATKGASEAGDALASDPPPDRWRRLHTLSGAMLGAFLVLHLVTQASALGGAALYGRVAGAIARSPVAWMLDLFVALPLAFHVVSGLRSLARRSAPDAEVARYGGRRLWTTQRLSAVIVLVFLLAHVGALRIGRISFGPGALYTVLVEHLSSTWAGVPWIALFYLLGVGGAALHLANGLPAAARGPEAARKRVRQAAYALGVASFAIGVATVIALATGGRLFGGDDAQPCGEAVPAEPAEPPSR